MSDLSFNELIRPEWFDDANCRGIDPELFFPARGDSHSTRMAKETCRECLVRLECLAFGLEQKYGIWGGRSERERRRMRRARAQGTAA